MATIQNNTTLGHANQNPNCAPGNPTFCHNLIEQIQNFFLNYIQSHKNEIKIKDKSILEHYVTEASLPMNEKPPEGYEISHGYGPVGNEEPVDPYPIPPLYYDPYEVPTI